MTHITDFISAAVMDKPVAATQAFSAAMNDRIENALTAKYDEVTNNVFNQPFNDTQGVVGEIENSDLETEMDDNNDV